MTPAQSRAARGLLDWSQEELAARASLHRTLIGAIERSEIAPTTDTVFMLAKAIGVETHVLLMAPAEAHPKILQAAG